MTNCFFVSIKSAFRPDDFYAHFPKEDNQDLPPNLFVPYFQNLNHLVSFLFQLAQFLESMYGYTQESRYYCSSHVLINNTKVDDRELGEFIHNLVAQEIKLEDMLKKGEYYGHGTFDPLLVLLCEFTGIEIHVKYPSHTKIQQFKNKASTRITIPEHVFVYKRLNTLIQSQVHLQFVDGHASFIKRIQLANKNPRKRKLI